MHRDGRLKAGREPGVRCGVPTVRAYLSCMVLPAGANLNVLVSRASARLTAAVERRAPAERGAYLRAAAAASDLPVASLCRLLDEHTLSGAGVDRPRLRALLAHLDADS